MPTPWDSTKALLRNTINELIPQRWNDVGAGSWEAYDDKVRDGSNVTLGAKADAAIIDPSLTASEISLLKGILTKLGSIATPMPVSTPVLNVATDSVRAYKIYPDSWVDEAGNRLTTKRATVLIAANATTDVIAAVTGKRLVVVQHEIVWGGAAGTVTLQDDTPTTLRLFQGYVAALAVGLAGATSPLFQTSVGKKLQVVSSAASLIGSYSCTYFEA